MKRFSLTLLLVILGAFAYAIPVSYNQKSADTEYVSLMPDKVVKAVIAECGWSGVPVDIGLALAWAESGGNAEAIHRNANGTRDMGVLQHNSRWVRYFAWKYNGGKRYDPYDYKVNIRIGLAYLADLHTYFGTWRLALQAYNCGPTNVDAGLVPKATKAYAEAILTGNFGS